VLLVYKLLLCFRYLRTRYLALLCVASVMLGVATLIVVNSVMSGFSNKLKTHMHGMMSDITIHTEATSGFSVTADELTRRIATTSAGRYVQATSPVIDFYAMLQFTHRTGNGRIIPQTKMVRIVGIDPKRHAQVGKFAEYLVNSKGNPGDCFQVSPSAQKQFDLNRVNERFHATEDANARRVEQMLQQNQALPFSPPTVASSTNPFGAEMPVIEPRPGESRPPIPAPNLPPLAPAQLSGVVLGFSIAHTRILNKETEQMEDYPFLLPGDDVFIATIGSSGTRPVSANFVVTDFLKTEMSEYDGNVIFVPVADLQRLRAMDDKVNSIQVRLTEDVRENMELVHKSIIPSIRSVVPHDDGQAQVQSWWQQQGPLFAAIDIERGLLNVLLFLIVGVAGFGVLAIFSMIVAEKYRDIGIMKSLGASNVGVMGIFVGYGLLLGIIGCGLGTLLGVLITNNLNEIEHVLAIMTGREIFDRKIYYFDKIPTNLETFSVVLVNIGAISIAVLSSILPAIRAARLQPVRALRFE
jgi:lipoprotein-releasing system permease protein